ncbi:MAG: sigma 54-interacting transcriptional regulator, partial [Polyangia bacterium]
ARQARPLVVLDCTAIPAALFAGHVFGYERGAFTGADRAHTGVFASAHGGTLFLDEVGDLAPALQPVLLRALERREVVPIGSARATRFDVRIVAATHRDLRREINAGRFRADLYYRLAGMEIRLPPLRQRLEDLPALLARFATSIRADAVAAGELTSERMLRELRAHPWPGNVRELRNFVERSLAMPGAAIDEPAAHGGWDLDASKPLRAARERWQGDVERRYFDELLRRNQHNVTKAAQAAGLARGHFYRLLKRHGLK